MSEPLTRAEFEAAYARWQSETSARRQERDPEEVERGALFATIERLDAALGEIAESLDVESLKPEEITTDVREWIALVRIAENARLK
jgi:hypothetical protein